MKEQNVSIVDYDKIEDKVKRTIQAIESKPHVRYIRYLLTKRYSPIVIKQELFRLGLSAPHEPNLIIYYMTIIDPIVKHSGLGSLYADYKNKLMRKKGACGDFAKDLLNYKLHLCDSPDTQVKFAKFIKTLEIDSLWINEIFKFHGTPECLPAEDGIRILGTNAPKKSIEKVLVHPKRYLIDKMILENFPDLRISKYCREKLNIPIYDHDVSFYKKIFFNIQTNAIEDKIKTLEVERNSLKTLLGDLDSLEIYTDMDIGEKLVIRKQAEQRIFELDDNVKTLNMMYSEFAFKSGTADQKDFEAMFADIVMRGYSRFVKLDGYGDRDVVDPLLKVAKIMANAHDKVEAIKITSGGGPDKHSQATLMELYKKRTDDILKEELERSNKVLAEAGITPIDEHIIPEDIAGTEDLGVNFDIEDEKDEK